MTVGAAANDEFVRLASPYRKELLAHCYRMLGSIHDAEDLVQETLLRAWRSYDDFEGRSSIRTWLYRIATNACLRALENRSRRPLPSGLGEPSENPDGPVPVPHLDVPWLQPFPDALTGGIDDPAAVIAARADLRLALIAALQYLPPRQRAVLILRDVLGWHAAEAAELLGVSTAAANSVLQRARAQIASVEPAEEDIIEPADPRLKELLTRYAAAFETADVARLTELLRADAVLEMPPMAVWFAGRDRIGRFLGRRVLTRPGEFALTPVRANGQPAFAAYLRGPTGEWEAHAIQVLTVGRGGISRIVSFNDGGLFPAFGLPGSRPGRESGWQPFLSRPLGWLTGAMAEQPPALRTWHAVAESGDAALLADLLADDVEFRSPAVFRPQQGKQLTTWYLTAAIAVLGPSLRYVHEWHDDSSAVLEFEAELDGVYVQGVDMLGWNSADKLVRFTVMVRPMRGLEKLIELMGRQLAAAQP